MAMLTARYDMGMSPIREALNRLQAERLVVAVPLRGFTVAPLSPEEFADATEARILIESEALRRAIALGDDAWEGAILAALHALSRQATRAESGDPDEIERLERRHHDFHHALLVACRSRWLMDFFQKLYAEAERYRYRALASRDADRARDVAGEHAALAEAAIGRQAERACELLALHYRRTQAYLAAKDERRNEALHESELV